MNTEMPISNNIKQIFDTLSQNGYESYLVGGCVRDFLLGKKPHDYDITTNATPEQVKALFAKTIDTGIQHGTVTVVINKEQFEITTYRIDGKYSDGRHPDEVQYANSLKEDLSRRDLTINALAYNPLTNEVIDYFKGQKDLSEGFIRTAGNPVDRFNEDALRMMRAIRFSCQLGFTIDKDTLNAISQLKDKISQVSKERIQAELTKSFLGSCVERNFHYYIDTGLLYAIDQRFKNLKHYTEIMKYFEVTSLKQDYTDYCATLFMMEDKTVIIDLLKDLKYPNEIIDKVEMTIEVFSEINVSYGRTDLNYFSKYLLNKYDIESIPLFEMIAIQNRISFNEKLNKFRTDLWDELEMIKYAKEPYLLKDLSINGNDLIKLDYSGKEIGEILSELQKEIWKDKDLNTKEKLMKFLDDNILCPNCHKLVPKEHYDKDQKLCENCIQAYEDYIQEQIKKDMKCYKLAREQYDFKRTDWKY